MTDPVTIAEVPGGWLVEAHFEPDSNPCCGPFHTDRAQAEAEARRKLPLVRWYRETNERWTDADEDAEMAIHLLAETFLRDCSPGVALQHTIDWWLSQGECCYDRCESRLLARNLPTGWTWLDPNWPPGAWVEWVFNLRRRPHLDYDPTPLDLEPDDGGAGGTAAEAHVGLSVGLGGVAAGAGDEDHGHPDSVARFAAFVRELSVESLGVSLEYAERQDPDAECFAPSGLPDVTVTFREAADLMRAELRRRGDVPPVAADGTWAEGLLGAAVAVGALHGPDPFYAQFGLCTQTSMDDCHAYGMHVPAADVFTRDRVRLRVVLREPVELYGLVWRENCVGFVPREE